MWAGVGTKGRTQGGGQLLAAPRGQRTRRGCCHQKHAPTATSTRALAGLAETPRPNLPQLLTDQDGIWCQKPRKAAPRQHRHQRTGRKEGHSTSHGLLNRPWLRCVLLIGQARSHDHTCAAGSLGKVVLGFPWRGGCEHDRLMEADTGLLTTGPMTCSSGLPLLGQWLHQPPSCTTNHLGATVPSHPPHLSCSSPITSNT